MAICLSSGVRLWLELEVCPRLVGVRVLVDMVDLITGWIALFGPDITARPFLPLRHGLIYPLRRKVKYMSRTYLHEMLDGTYRGENKWFVRKMRTL